MTPAEELLKAFRTNVRVNRERIGMSQSELGRKIGKTPGYICDIERGRRCVQGPNLSTLAEISKGLGVPASRLVSIPKQR